MQVLVAGDAGFIGSHLDVRLELLRDNDIVAHALASREPAP